MATHRDFDHGQQESVLERLRLKAQLMTELGKLMTELGNNRMTNQRPLEEWTHDGIRIQMLPEDSEGVLSIFIGGHPDLHRNEYCNFCGDQGKCIRLLERCLSAMKSYTP